MRAAFKTLPALLLAAVLFLCAACSFGDLYEKENAGVSGAAKSGPAEEERYGSTVPPATESALTASASKSATAPKTTAAPKTAASEGTADAGKYSSHFALRRKNAGSCGAFTGSQYIILIFVSTPEHPWTPEQKEAVNSVSRSSIRLMEQEAKEYNADLRLKFGGIDYSIPFEYEYNNNAELKWYRYILDRFYHVESITEVYDHYRESLKVDNAPIIFLFNSWDTSRAWSCSANNPDWKEEFCVIFCDTDMHDNYLTHELLHLYGAIDLYDYHSEGVQAVAEQLFPDSDMMYPSHEIDPLTAYLVGWTDVLTPKAESFLRQTDGLR